MDSKSIVVGEAYCHWSNRKAVVLSPPVGDRVTVRWHGGQESDVMVATLTSTWAERRARINEQRERQARQRDLQEALRREGAALTDALESVGIDAKRAGMHLYGEGSMAFSFSIDEMRQLREIVSAASRPSRPGSALEDLTS